jgi:hypothetical protein
MPAAGDSADPQFRQTAEPSGVDQQRRGRIDGYIAHVGLDLADVSIVALGGCSLTFLACGESTSFATTWWSRATSPSRVANAPSGAGNR